MGPGSPTSSSGSTPLARTRRRARHMGPYQPPSGPFAHVPATKAPWHSYLYRVTGWRLTSQEQLDVDSALLAYWTARDEAELAQQRAGRLDVGGRAGVTSGGHLDQVAQLFARVCVDAGVPRQEIWYKAPAGDPWKRSNVARGFTLPGYFRPNKQWDLVVYHQGNPIIAIELKSQNGPSYGNNANNRAEEAIGNAVDLRHAVAAGLLPDYLWTATSSSSRRKTRQPRTAAFATRDVPSEGPDVRKLELCKSRARSLPPAAGAGPVLIRVGSHDVQAASLFVAGPRT